MLKISLKLHRSEVGVILTFCTDRELLLEDAYFRQHMSLNGIILAEHYERIRRQFFAWSHKPTSKAFTYSMPVSVAYALHTELQVSPTHWPEAQSLLNKLNLALVNCHFQPQILECHD